jgi:hypothetical protein
METSDSPWKVRRDAYEFALKVWPNLYSSPWRRHDFMLPQLFACLLVREHLKLSTARPRHCSATRRTRWP